MVITVSVQIDRYKITNSHYSINDGAKGIYDFYKNMVIATIGTPSEELNQMLAELILAELNTGKYEEQLKGD